jgi:hypothetical protein
MKKSLFIILMILSSTAYSQRWGRELGLNYIYANPIGGMGHIIERGHGGTLNYGFVTPDHRFAIGLDMSIAQYGRDKSRQEYTLDDGTVAPMDIIVSNSFVNVMFYGRWYAKLSGPIRPYLSAKAGYSRFTTNLNIYDPDDWDHCEPVDTDVLYGDGTIVGSLGAGMRLDLSSIFKKLDAGKFYFESAFNLTQGGQVRYMNADAPMHQHSGTPDADYVMADFKNTETLIVHQHHVGYLYRSPVQMTELRFGFALHLD